MKSYLMTPSRFLDSIRPVHIGFVTMKKIVKFVPMKVILKEIEEHLPLIQLGVQVGSLFVKQQANQRQHQAYIDMEKHKYDKKIELAHGLTPALEKAVEKDPGAPISEVANIFYAVLNHDRDSDQE